MKYEFCFAIVRTNCGSFGDQFKLPSYQEHCVVHFSRESSGGSEKRAVLARKLARNDIRDENSILLFQHFAETAKC